MNNKEITSDIADKSTQEFYTPLPKGYKHGQTKYVVVTGSVNEILKGINMANALNVKYWAASCPTCGYSFTGSCLPFPNEDVAYENTPNQGTIEIYDINFSLKFIKPNSYYTNQGKVLVKPHVNIMFMTGDNKPLGTIYKIDIDNYIPYRTLSMERKNVMFYHNAPLPIRTQEEIIRDSAYPEQTMKEHKNFWGLKPSN